MTFYNIMITIKHELLPDYLSLDEADLLLTNRLDVEYVSSTHDKIETARIYVFDVGIDEIVSTLFKICNLPFISLKCKKVENHRGAIIPVAMTSKLDVYLRRKFCS